MDKLEFIKDIEPWFASGLEVRRSSIHGFGLFTVKPFSSGCIIIRLGGRLFHVSKRRSSHVMPSTTTLLSEEIFLAESSGGNKDLSDYLNHSCDPNIGFSDAITIVTIKNVNADEELLIDYAFCECDPEWKLKSNCSCNSRNCRKAVSGEDWRRFSQRDINFQYFSPFLKRRILASTMRETQNDK